MSFGTRFRSTPETISSLRTTVGAALIGAALLGGSLGLTGAQDASPEASPMASPVAAIDWIDQVPLAEGFEFDGDQAAVGVKLTDPATINVAEIEFRPYIILQAENLTDTAQNVAVFSVPEGYDATTFTFPASEADLPEGVTPVGTYQVAPGERASAVFEGLAEGAYIVATDGGITIPFAVVPVADLGVPDIFGTPEGTPAS
ncbi:MAG: hypothetical protein M3457_20260 [Chloroflexota bacterium]|nr:hypothetical protein [Chloroflexota bacterium]